MIQRIGGYGLVTALLLSFLGCGRDMVSAKNQPLAAAALFQNFETVFCVKSSTLSNVRSQEHEGRASSNALFLPFSELQDALKALAGSSATILTKSEAVLVGARDFSAPEGLGPVHSERCYIILLRRQKFDFAPYSRRARTISVAGTQVSTWSAQLGAYGEENPKPSSFFASQISDQYLLVANNLDDLRTTRKALSSLESPDEVLAGVREWKYLNQHDLWGYRQYRRRESASEGGVDASFPIASAEALSFYADFSKNAGTVNLISSGRDEESVLRANRMTESLLFKRQGAQVWTLAVPLSGDNSADQLVRVMSLFGFGMFL